jgi:hypothetical protein
MQRGLQAAQIIARQDRAGRRRHRPLRARLDPGFRRRLRRLLVFARADQRR